MSYYTEDLLDFGFRELDMVGDLLKAFKGLNDHTVLLGNGVKPAMNTGSGSVFLVDEDYNVGMMNGDYLDDFLTCPDCGYEGFIDDILTEGSVCCIKWLYDMELIEQEEYVDEMRARGE